MARYAIVDRNTLTTTNVIEWDETTPLDLPADEVAVPARDDQGIPGELWDGDLYVLRPSP